MSYELPHNNTEELRRDFDSIDADGDGFLDFDEMLWDTPRLSIETYRDGLKYASQVP